MKTRQKILVKSLELFNLFGEPNISTVDIANEMNISPGNLYYHYRNKEDILLGLFNTYESELLTILNSGTNELADIVEIWLYFKLLYEKLWQYRFLYRDLNNIMKKNKMLEKKFKRIFTKKKAVSQLICNNLIRSGSLSSRNHELSALVENMVFHLIFWINHELINESQTHQYNRVENRGVYQLMTLLMPYLTTAVKQIISELSLSDLA